MLTSHKTVTGAWVSVGPMVRLEANGELSVIGASVVDVLLRSGAIVENPSAHEFRGMMVEMLGPYGFKSFNSLEKGAKCVNMSMENDELIVFEPTVNSGRGIFALNEQKSSLSVRLSDGVEAVGGALLDAFLVSVVSARGVQRR